MGVKGTCWEEQRVFYVSDESLGSTPETSTKLYVNLNLNRYIKNKKIIYSVI